MSYSSKQQSAVNNLTPYRPVVSPKLGFYKDFTEETDTSLNGINHSNRNPNGLNGLGRFKSQPNLLTLRETESGRELINGAYKQGNQNILLNYDQGFNNHFGNGLIMPPTSQKSSSELIGTGSTSRVKESDIGLHREPLTRSTGDKHVHPNSSPTFLYMRHDASRSFKSEGSQQANDNQQHPQSLSLFILCER